MSAVDDKLDRCAYCGGKTEQEWFEVHIETSPLGEDVPTERWFEEWFCSQDHLVAHLAARPADTWESACGSGGKSDGFQWSSLGWGAVGVGAFLLFPVVWVVGLVSVALAVL